MYALTHVIFACETQPAVKTKRINANLPAELLEAAQKETGDGITETLIAGLNLILRKSAARKLRALKTKVAVKEDGGRSGDSRNS